MIMTQSLADSLTGSSQILSRFMISDGSFKPPLVSRRVAAAQLNRESIHCLASSAVLPILIIISNVRIKQREKSHVGFVHVLNRHMNNARREIDHKTWITSLLRLGKCSMRICQRVRLSFVLKSNQAQPLSFGSESLFFCL